jgi:hypothetical protein
MRNNRIIFCNWIAESGRGQREPEQPNQGAFSSLDELAEEELERQAIPTGSDNRRKMICEQVASAVRLLDDDEREFVARFYHMGESYREISEKSGRQIYSLEAIHKRALKKLRRSLVGLVEREFGYAAPNRKRPCLVCDSGHRHEIDELIASRPPDATWRMVVRAIAQRYDIRIVTPQVLIGHQKYH